MHPIIEKNISRYRELGTDRFTAWLKAKLYEGERGDSPFSFESRYDFEDILQGIYRNLTTREKSHMKWAFSQASKDWKLSEHGFYTLRKLYDWALITECIGVFEHTLEKIENWSPVAGDYNNIIEFGKIANSLWAAKVKFGDKKFSETPFFTIARHFKEIILNDEDERFKLIYSPLFLMGCHADLKDWPELAAIITKRYSYNKKDPWPKECAIFKNCAGESGFFDLQATLLTFLTYLNVVDQSLLHDGCRMLCEDYPEIGGRECFEEIEINDMARRVTIVTHDKNEKSRTVTSILTGSKILLSDRYKRIAHKKKLGEKKLVKLIGTPSEGAKYFVRPSKKNKKEVVEMMELIAGVSEKKLTI